MYPRSRTCRCSHSLPNRKSCKLLITTIRYWRPINTWSRSLSGWRSLARETSPSFWTWQSTTQLSFAIWPSSSIWWSPKKLAWPELKRTNSSKTSFTSKRMLRRQFWSTSLQYRMLSPNVASLASSTKLSSKKCKNRMMSNTNLWKPKRSFTKQCWITVCAKAILQNSSSRVLTREWKALYRLTSCS